MARKPFLPSLENPGTLHSPMPRPALLRIDYLRSDKGLTTAEVIFHAINALSIECGLDPLPDSVIEDFVPYPPKKS